MSWVIRCKYTQPDGIGWVDEGGHCYHDPSYAHRFATEDDAWAFLGLNYERLGGSDDAWPEEARDYTPEERQAILTEYLSLRRTYYHRADP